MSYEPEHICTRHGIPLVPIYGDPNFELDCPECDRENIESIIEAAEMNSLFLAAEEEK